MNTYKKNSKAGSLKQTVLALAALALFSLPLLAGTGRRVAFAVGVGEYTEYPALKAAAGDAHTISRALTGRGFDAVDTLTDADVSYSHLLEGITELANELDDNDLLVLYVAAHGWVDNSDGTALILPATTRRGFEREDGIDLAKLVREVSSLTAARIVVMLDACFAGAFDLTHNEERLTFWAGARANEWAFEDKDHGLFTGQLLKYLHGKSRYDISASVTQGVIRETGGWQRPELNPHADHSALALL